MPDKRRLGKTSNLQAWAEYCAHQVTSSGNKKVSGKEYYERFYNHTKYENLDQIENVILQENVFAKLEEKTINDGVIFNGSTKDGKHFEIITRLDKYGNLDADLTEVTSLATKKKAIENPPHRPLAEVVETVAKHQAAGFTPPTANNITLFSKKSSENLKKDTESPEFKRWFKKSKVVDEVSLKVSLKASLKAISTQKSLT